MVGRLDKRDEDFKGEDRGGAVLMWCAHVQQSAGIHAPVPYEELVPWYSLYYRTIDEGLADFLK